MPVTQLLKQADSQFNIDDMTRTILHILHEHLTMSVWFYYVATVLDGTFPRQTETLRDMGQSQVQLGI